MRRTKRTILWFLAAAVLTAVVIGILPAVNGASSQPIPVSAEAQYAAAAESMLYIRCFYASGGLKTTGSGFVIEKGGLALTAAHVIEKAARITATDSGGRELACDVVSSDPESDVAVLRLPGGSYKALRLADGAAAGGAQLRAMGYPNRNTLLITEGLVSAPSGTVRDRQRMLVSCQIVNGMSGGPIFDSYGRVAGLCSGSVRTMNGIHLSALWSDLRAAVSAAQSGK